MKSCTTLNRANVSVLEAVEYISTGLTRLQLDVFASSPLSTEGLCSDPVTRIRVRSKQFVRNQEEIRLSSLLLSFWNSNGLLDESQFAATQDHAYDFCKDFATLWLRKLASLGGFYATANLPEAYLCVQHATVRILKHYHDLVPLATGSIQVGTFRNFLRVTDRALHAPILSIIHGCGVPSTPLQMYYASVSDTDFTGGEF